MIVKSKTTQYQITFKDCYLEQGYLENGITFDDCYSEQGYLKNGLTFNIRFTLKNCVGKKRLSKAEMRSIRKDCNFQEFLRDEVLKNIAKIKEFKKTTTISYCEMRQGSYYASSSIPENCEIRQGAHCTGSLISENTLTFSLFWNIKLSSSQIEDILRHALEIFYTERGFFQVSRHFNCGKWGEINNLKYFYVTKKNDYVRDWVY